MLGMFVVRQEDQIAQQAALVIQGRFPVKELGPGELAGANDIAFVGWAPHARNGLKHGFPSSCLRLAPEKRIQRERLPQEVGACKRIVYVRENPGRDANEFTLAVLAMLHSLGLSIAPEPSTQTSVPTREHAFV